jgi:Rhs element Vgr protein
MAVSPNKNTNGVVRVSVFSNGNPIKTTLFGLVSAYIYKGVNRIGKAILVFSAGDMAKNDVPESDTDTFAPGKRIRLEAGYGDDENPIFEGLVVNHCFTIGENNDARLEIECRDYAFPSTLARKNAVYEKKKDSDIISAIMGKYDPLSVSTDATKTKYNELVQYYATDWDFVRSRADANGLVVVTEGTKMTVKKPDVNSNPALKVTYGTDLIEFKGELLAADCLGDIDALAWNPDKQDVTKVSGEKPSLNSQGNMAPDKLAKAVGVNKCVLQTECAEESALQAWANSQRLKAGLSHIQGYCKFIGSAEVLHGETLEINGLGARFNGTAYIGYVEHEIRRGKWTTTAGLGLPAENITEHPDVVAPPVSGLLPGMEGLHIGKVIKLDGDPTNGNKIQVEIPILGDKGNKIWARLNNFWANNGYGSFFIPEVGDEVVLGFFNSDPSYPVILGSLYSSKRKPPYGITKENNIQALVTKSKIKVELNDKDKIITLETPAKNTVIISDKDKSITLKDESGNKIVMEKGGITVESAKDLTLKAKMNVKIEAGANLDAQAKSNLTLKGLKIEASANTELAMKGTAKAEISAAGQTIVKGAMVMIN